MPWQLEHSVTNAVGAAPGVGAAVSHEDIVGTPIAPPVPVPVAIMPAAPVEPPSPEMTVVVPAAPVGLVADPVLPEEPEPSAGFSVVVLLIPGNPVPGPVVCPVQPKQAAITKTLAPAANVRAMKFAALTGSRFEIMRSPSSKRPGSSPPSASR